MNTLYVFIGPKGSGKSYIGRLLERECGIQFLAIEEIFIKLQSTGISSADVQEKGYKLVEEQVTDIFTQGNAVSFEITVLMPASKALLERLSLQADIEMIEVYAPPEICLGRIRSRDAAKHIEISEERIREINQISAAQQLTTKLRIDTSETNDGEIVERFRAVYSE